MNVHVGSEVHQPFTLSHQDTDFGEGKSLYRVKPMQDDSQRMVLELDQLFLVFQLREDKEG